MVNFTLPSLPNRIAGIIFGALNGFLTVTLLFILIRLFPAGDGFLKKHVTPDRTTDEIINRTLEIADVEEILEISEHDADGKSYSRIGYAAYRISSLMDPFLDNLGSMLRKKYDEVIEAKVLEKIDELKDGKD
jgi:hypothetical protein